MLYINEEEDLINKGTHSSSFTSNTANSGFFSGASTLFGEYSS